jgi:outer membrane lipoprotein-sorting protein
MTISKGKRNIIKNFYGYGQSKGDKAFMVFTNPEDRGVKYLKLNKELWIYFPDADDTMKISGHMLRQGMMGSDISYEDMLETDNLEKEYSFVLKGTKTLQGNDCYVVDLEAVVENAAYARQVIYVDKVKFLPLKLELFARGGRLLKVIEQGKIFKAGGRYLPREITIRDMRRSDSRTKIRFEKIEFDVVLPGNIFHKKNLRR